MKNVQSARLSKPFQQKAPRIPGGLIWELRWHACNQLPGVKRGVIMGRLNNASSLWAGKRLAIYMVYFRRTVNK